MTQKDTVLDALTTTPPKWVAKFQQQNYDAGRLPFILIYRARGIMKTIPKKTSAIAVSTKALQKEGVLLENSNKLSLYGELLEIGKLTELGRERTLEIIRDFDSSQG
jgi:hypothetical protein